MYGIHLEIKLELSTQRKHMIRKKMFHCSELCPLAFSLKVGRSHVIVVHAGICEVNLLGRRAHL